MVDLIFVGEVMVIVFVFWVVSVVFVLVLLFVVLLDDVVLCMVFKVLLVELSKYLECEVMCVGEMCVVVVMF